MSGEKKSVDLSKLSDFKNLFDLKVKQGNGKTGNKKKKPAPWDGICCETCWNATKENCVCRCGGANHGRGKSGDYVKLEGFEDAENK